MGVLFDYFAASSDERAAETIDLVGGPADAGLPVVQTKGIDPVVQMGKLESLLTGAGYDTVVARSRSGHAVAIRDEGERLVLSITDELQHALAHASREQLDTVAVPWTEEFWGNASPEMLAAVLRQLAEVARSASSGGDRLYCWVCM